jgi:hypothetical protein
VVSWLSEAFWLYAILSFTLFCCVEKRNEKEKKKDSVRIERREDGRIVCVAKNGKRNINNALCHGPGEFGPPIVARCYQGGHAKRRRRGDWGDLSIPRSAEVDQLQNRIDLQIEAQTCLLWLTFDVCVRAVRERERDNIRHNMRPVSYLDLES